MTGRWSVWIGRILSDLDDRMPLERQFATLAGIFTITSIYDLDDRTPIQDVDPFIKFQEDVCFVVSASYLESFFDDGVLYIPQKDRTVMLRYELKSLCQYRYRDALNDFFYDIHGENLNNHRENVCNHIVTTRVAAFGIPAISFVLGCALLWVGRGFRE